MSDWPDTLTVAPIREWPGELTRLREPSRFKAPLRSTLQLLDREIWHLTDTVTQQKSAELLLAIAPEQFRLDGRPRAQATAAHPGVIFSLDSRYGRVSYPCDTFTTWQDNLRAIALALEALRKVDRYGVTKRGEQYRGFLGIESTPAAAGFPTSADALDYLWTFVGAADPSKPHSLDWVAGAVRAGKRSTHPDLGGDANEFQRVALAEAKLREAGVL